MSFSANKARKRRETGLLILGLCSLLVGRVIANGQDSTPTDPRNSSAATLPQFEVASVKLAVEDRYGPVGLYTYAGGKVVAAQVTLRMLLRYALDADSYQLVGGPNWTDTQRFDVVGLPPDSSSSRNARPVAINAPPTDEQRQMLLRLLIDRFDLHFHRELRPGAVYTLERGKGRLEIAPAVDTTVVPWMANLYERDGQNYGRVSATNVTMKFVARRLSSVLMCPVVDATNVDGAYDFQLSPDVTPIPDAKEAMLEAMKRLGFALKPGRGSAGVFVVDGAKLPKPN